MGMTRRRLRSTNSFLAALSPLWARCHKVLKASRESSGKSLMARKYRDTASRLSGMTLNKTGIHKILTAMPPTDSGRPDLNRRPLGPEPSALPTALRPETIGELPHALYNTRRADF